MGCVVMGDTEPAWLLQDGDRARALPWMDATRGMDTRGSIGHLLHQSPFL